MTAKEKVIGITIKKKGYDNDGRKLFEICREISTKEISYRGENCGHPTSYIVCKEILSDKVEG